MTAINSSIHRNLMLQLFPVKKVFYILFFIPAFAFSQTPDSPPTNPNPIVGDAQTPAFQFKEELWDFGNIPQGSPVTHIFEYSNSGKQPLIVSQVTASCGCTTPVWTKEPVRIGKTGTVAVIYNAAREGSFTKTVTVLANTSQPKYLIIKGNVIAKKPSDNSNVPNKQ